MSDFSTARQRMVDCQVRPSDVTDLRIVDAMLAVPREVFVPERQRALAYLDLDVQVSEGNSARRFLIKPAVTAKMLQAADVSNNDHVLDVGCATGYSSAVLARLARSVVALEEDPTLRFVGNLVTAAVEGDEANAPYDVIVLDGATQKTPDGLYGQLKEGGRLVGVFAMTQPPRAMVVTRSRGDFGHRTLFDASVPVLPGLERRPAFVF